MADAIGYIWLRQAESDRLAGERAFIEDDDSTYCQSLAKYQQVVEKSVKAVVAALHESRILSVTPSRKHDLSREIDALKHIPFKKGSRDQLIGEVKSFIGTDIRADILTLSNLSPAGGPHGQQELRNTEYPFQWQDGVWTFPAQQGVFRKIEVEDYRLTADRTLKWASSIVEHASYTRRR